MDLARAPRRAPLTARKKGSGYENDNCCRNTILHQSISGSRIICSQEANFGMFVHTERGKYFMYAYYKVPKMARGRDTICIFICCITLHCHALHCISTALGYIRLHYTALPCISMHYPALACIRLH